MIKKPDADGRYPLTGREWQALRCLIVALNELDVCNEQLRDRCSLIPGGWRDLRLMLRLAEKLWDSITKTIPDKKLRVISEEIKHCHISLVVEGASSVADKSVVWMDESAYVHMMDRIIGQECWCCERTGKDVKRCEIKKLILSTLRYESDPAEYPEDGACELAGHTTILREEQ